MIESIEKRLQVIDDYFRSNDSTSTEKERLYSRIIKLNEEVGELCEAVLKENDIHQREKGKTIDLDEELADVLICTLLLAQKREKNIWSTIDRKLQKQFVRFNLS